MPLMHRRTEEERRAAALQADLLIGMVVGFLVGLWVGMLGVAVSVWMHTVQPSSAGLTPLIANPLLTGILGAMVGLIAGAAVGWTVSREPVRHGPRRYPRRLAGGER